MISITGRIVGGQETLQKFAALEARVRDDLKHTIHLTAEALKTKVQGKLSGPVLKAPTGALKGSINVKDDFTTNSITSSVGVNLGSIPYARIHEYGGTILPKNGPYLVFKTPDGAWHKVTRVVMPERSYLRSSLAEMAPFIEKAIRASLKKSIKAAGFK